MTTQLDHVGGELLEDADECGGSDRLGVGSARPVLAVELPDERDLRIEVPKRDPEVVRDRLEDRAKRIDAVSMLMRVEMRGIPSHKSTKPFELRTDVS